LKGCIFATTLPFLETLLIPSGGLVDCRIAGLIFAWLYNQINK